MIAWFLLGVGLLVAGLLLVQWFATAPPRSVLRFTGWTLAVVVGLLVVFLGVTGRLGWALAGLAGLAPLAGRLLRYLPGGLKAPGTGSNNGGGGAQRQSTVNSVYLRMTLDHVTGEMTGEVLKGQHTGADLAELDDDTLFSLLDTCRAEDPSGVRLLETWLDRNRGPEWRQAEQARGTGGGGSPGGSMTVEEAREVLGVPGDADADAIKAAHRRLIQRLHPDHGGTDYLAGRVNRARAVLLNET